MSKSLGNYIGIAEPPREMFGKLMSISDQLMWRYIELLSFQPGATIERWKAEVRDGRNPREIKVAFAKEIVARFQGRPAADAAQEEFEQRFRHGVLPEDMPEVTLQAPAEGLPIAQLLKAAQLTASTSEATRAIEQGGVRIDGERVGNFERFPAATLHLQELEMRYATGRYMCSECFRGAFEAEDVVGVVRRVYQGRVRFHDGDSELAPGISLHLIGGHTMGLQVVRIATRRGALLLASDASHFYANMAEARPFPIVWSVADMLDGYGRMGALAESPAHIIPGHDPLVLERYPAPEAALKGVVARLD